MTQLLTDPHTGTEFLVAGTIFSNSEGEDDLVLGTSDFSPWVKGVGCSNLARGGRLHRANPADGYSGDKWTFYAPGGDNILQAWQESLSDSIPKVEAELAANPA